MSKIGVYVLLKGKKVVYIGRTKYWPGRLQGHTEIDFDGSKIIECDESQLIVMERRLIEIFKPKHNHMDSKPLIRKMTYDWVRENKLLIETGDDIEITTKARIDLGFSPKTLSADMIWPIRRRYEKLFGTKERKKETA